MARTAARHRAASALLALVAGALCLGILAMHALDVHGSMAQPSHRAAAVSHDVLPAASPAHAGATTTGAAATGAAALGPSVADHGSGSHGMGTMVMLCVAMLAGAWLLVIALLVRRLPPRVWAVLGAVPRRALASITTRRATGPPPVWEFSVIRC